MDALSRLLSLYPLHTALDTRCRFGAPWLIAQPPSAPGVAPYHLIVQGRASADTDQEKGLPLQTGDIIVFPHGAAHQIHTGDPQAAAPARQAAGEHPVRLLHNDGAGPVADILCGEFRFDPTVTMGGGLLAALPPVLIVRSAERPDAAGLRQLIAMLQAEAETPRAGSGAIVGQLASALFALLIRSWLEQALTVPGLFAVLADRRLQAALHGMLAAPEQAWSLEQLAATCHMSRATFARLFRQAANATPADVLAQLRMARAARLLADGQGKLAAGDVAEAVGYQSEAAFNRAFKRQHGVGPGAYKRQARRSVDGTVD
jgi:AraC family transcriptional activator of mtrCDE